MRSLRRKGLGLALLLLTQFACADHGPAPSAVDGVLDLRDWSFKSNGSVQLAGNWGFCWGELLTPGQAPAEPEGCGTVQIPGLWTDEANGIGSGYATYRLRILLPEEHPVLALNVGAPLTAHRLWVNGQSYDGTGTVARQSGDYVSQLQNRLHVLSDSGDELRLLVQVANFDFRSGGLRRRWILGEYSAVRSWANAVTVRDASMATISILMGLLFLGFFAFRPEERTRLYFGLTGIALGLRVVPGNYSEIGQLIAPDMLFPAALRLEYFANNFVAFTVMGYFANKVPRDTPIFISRFIQLGLFAGMLGALFLPLSMSQIPMRCAWILGVGALLTALFSLTKARYRGEPDISITLFCMPVLMGTVALDAFRAEDVISGSTALIPGSSALMVLIESNALFPMTLLLVLLTEAMLLMRNFSRSYDTIETLSKDLLASNEGLRETNRAVVRFVPFEFLRILKKDSIREVRRGDCIEKEMSIMFCDIRSFTPLVESMTPDDAFRFVNSFTEWMEPPIHNHGGFINQYLGDCIMALFPTGADEAVRAGIDMELALDGFNNARREGRPFRKATRIGIGINTGSLMVGTIGGPDRLDNAVIGDAVNVASRVESLTKLYGTSFLISGNTYRGLSNASAYQFRQLDRVVVQGRSEPVPIYEVLDGLDVETREAKLHTRERFDEARSAYANQAFAQAEKLFGECLTRSPNDAAAKLYIARCRRLVAQGAPRNWQVETVV